MSERKVLYTGIDSAETAEVLRRRRGGAAIELPAFNRLESVSTARYVFELTVRPEQAELVNEQAESGIRAYKLRGYESAWLLKAPVGDPISAGPH